MKKIALFIMFFAVMNGFAVMPSPQKIGSIPASAIKKIDKIADKTVYTAEFETKQGGQTTKGSISCWKEKSGRIGCTESGTVFSGGSATTYQRQIADNNYYTLEKMYKRYEK